MGQTDWRLRSPRRSSESSTSHRRRHAGTERASTCQLDRYTGRFDGDTLRITKTGGYGSAGELVHYQRDEAGKTLRINIRRRQLVSGGCLSTAICRAAAPARDARHLMPGSAPREKPPTPS